MSAPEALRGDLLELTSQHILRTLLDLTSPSYTSHTVSEHWCGDSNKEGYDLHSKAWDDVVEATVTHLVARRGYLAGLTHEKLEQDEEPTSHDNGKVQERLGECAPPE